MSDFIKNMKIALTAQGHDAEIIAAEYPPEIVAEWLTYGCRRWYQDNINSVAKKLRDEGAEVDGAALFADRDKQARNGEVSRRRSADGMSGTEKAAFQLFVDAQAWGKKIKADTKRERMQPVWDEMPDEQKKVWMQDARDEADRQKAAQERRARLAAAVGPIKLA